jgi:two-component system, NtrC family, response regulator HydG
MDVMMPGRNGVESFLEIRKLRPDAKVFMMTGYSVEQLLHRAMQHGAMGILNKPLDVSSLLKIMAEVKPNGFVVVAEDAVSSGAEATIIDLGLPLINGVEVYARLQRAGLSHPAIIIAKSNGSRDNSLHTLRDVAVTGILNKPFDPVALLDRLNQLAA